MTYTPPTVTDYAALPWDTDALVAEVLEVVRLDASDADAERIARAVTGATELIDEELDADADELTARGWLTDANIPRRLKGAAVTIAVELYRRKDAPFGVLDSWGTDGVAIRLPADVLRGVRSVVRKSKDRWGVG